MEKHSQFGKTSIFINIKVSKYMRIWEIEYEQEVTLFIFYYVLLYFVYIFVMINENSVVWELKKNYYIAEWMWKSPLNYISNLLIYQFHQSNPFTKILDFHIKFQSLLTMTIHRFSNKCLISCAKCVIKLVLTHIR